MLTRKRQKEINCLKTQKISNLAYTFHPIFESICRFLDFQDVASGACVNSDFFGKLWLYVLRSSTRDSELNTHIFINHESASWIAKFSQELKYQRFDLSYTEKNVEQKRNKINNLTMK